MPPPLLLGAEECSTTSYTCECSDSDESQPTDQSTSGWETTPEDEGVDACAIASTMAAQQPVHQLPALRQECSSALHSSSTENKAKGIGGSQSRAQAAAAVPPLGGGATSHKVGMPSEGGKALLRDDKCLMDALSRLPGVDPASQALHASIQGLRLLS